LQAEETENQTLRSLRFLLLIPGHPLIYIDCPALFDINPPTALAEALEEAHFDHAQPARYE
jgi:hypothetical protein